MNRQNEVVHCTLYMFHKKPQSNKFTMMVGSALPDRVKRSTMTNEALRRPLCCSPNLEEYKQIEVMEEFARMLKRSGYPAKFRFEVISDAVRGYQKMVKTEEEGGHQDDHFTLPLFSDMVESSWVALASSLSALRLLLANLRTGNAICNYDDDAARTSSCLALIRHLPASS